MGWFSLRATILLVALAVLFSILVSMPASAQTEGCLPDVGKRIPVLFVHGFGASQRVWNEGSPSMFEAVDAISKGYSTLFDYSQENLRWVDHPNLGPRLVHEINCRAQSSREQGGPGKVVLVTHSMGGLAARYAATNGAADSIGMVITIGTPNLGSVLANSGLGAAYSMCRMAEDGSLLQLPSGVDKAACELLVSAWPQLQAISGLREDSLKLARLGWVPTSIPVFAIAGNVQWRFRTFVGDITAPPSNSDLVVATESALQGHTKREVVCSGFIMLPLISDASCEHGRLLRDSDVQRQVVVGIQQYLTSLTTAQCAPAETFVSLLQQEDEGMEGPERHFTVVKGPVCQDGYAAAVVDDGGTLGWISMVLHFENGTWQRQLAGSYLSDEQCAALPSKLYAFFDTADSCVAI